MTDLTEKQLAKVAVRAHEIREASWNGTRYELDQYQSVDRAAVETATPPTEYQNRLAWCLIMTGEVNEYCRALA